eukprot:765390-Hanusia_phi.AAC.3
MSSNSPSSSSPLAFVFSLSSLHCLPLPLLLPYLIPFSLPSLLFPLADVSFHSRSEEDERYAYVSPGQFSIIDRYTQWFYSSEILFSH